MVDEQSDTRLSFLATAGMGFVLNDRLVGDVSYRYQHTPDLEHVWTYSDADLSAEERLETDLSQHSVSVGLRYMMQKPRP